MSPSRSAGSDKDTLPVTTVVRLRVPAKRQSTLLSARCNATQVESRPLRRSTEPGVSPLLEEGLLQKLVRQRPLERGDRPSSVE